MQLYVYRITNNVDGKTYIGQHVHRNGTDKYMGSGKLLRIAMNQFGKESFSKTILYNAYDKEDLDEAEIQMIWVERFSGKAEYNIADGGYTDVGPRTKQHGANISKALKGRPVSDETRKRISESLKERFKDPKNRKLVSDVIKNKWNDPEYKEKQDIANEYKKTLPSPMKGKTHSVDVKKLLSKLAKKQNQNRGQDGRFIGGKDE